MSAEKSKQPKQVAQKGEAGNEQTATERQSATATKEFPSWMTPEQVEKMGREAIPRMNARKRMFDYLRSNGRYFDLFCAEHGFARSFDNKGAYLAWSLLWLALCRDREQTAHLKITMTGVLQSVVARNFDFYLRSIEARQDGNETGQVAGYAGTIASVSADVGRVAPRDIAKIVPTLEKAVWRCLQASEGKKQVVFTPLVDAVLKSARSTNGNADRRLTGEQIASEVMPRVRKFYHRAQRAVPILAEADINDQLYHLWFGPQNARQGPLQVSAEQYGRFLARRVRDICSPHSIHELAQNIGYRYSPLVGAQKKQMLFLGEIIAAGTAIMVHSVHEVFENVPARAIVEAFTESSRDSFFAVMRAHDSSFDARCNASLVLYANKLKLEDRGIGLSSAFLTHIGIDAERNEGPRAYVARRFKELQLGAIRTLARTAFVE